MRKWSHTAGLSHADADCKSAPRDRGVQANVISVVRDMNPKGIPYSSLGLRGTSYPREMAPIDDPNPNGQRGCGKRTAEFRGCVENDR